MTQTPLEVEILLHYHCSDSEHPNAGSPAGQTAINNFVSKGLLGRRDDGTHWGVPGALDIYVKAVCDVPLPIKVWMLPKS